MLELVEIVEELPRGDFEGLELVHLREVDALEIFVRDLEAQVLQVDELAEE